jgi:LPS-assembly protein
MLMAAVAALAAPAPHAHAQNIPPVLLQAHHGPVNVTARQFEYDYKTDTFVATGDAVVSQANTTLTADRIDVLRKVHQAAAYGHVHLIDPEGQMFGSQAQVDWDNETAILTDGKLAASNNTYRVQGKRIYKLVGQNYIVNDGFFTTCGCGGDRPDWAISGGDIDLHVGGEGVAHHAHFDVLGYPVIPLPYALFPANTSRQTGLLTPRVGESGLRGFQYLQPFYWAINKSSDATVALDVETSQRIGLLGEYRLQNGEDDYLRVNGAFMDESIRSQSNRLSDIVDTQIADPHIPVDRYDIIGMMRQHLTDDLVAYGDAVSVSDSLYLREMNIWTLSRGYGNSFNTMRDAVSHFGLIDSFENGYAQFSGTWNQDLIQPQEFALQTLPEFSLSGRQELLGGLAYADYNVEGDNFWQYRGVSGLRLDINPQLTVPWRLGEYLYGWGGLGMHETIYDTSGHQIEVTPVGTDGLLYNNGLSLGPLAAGGLQSRELPYANFGAATIIEKIYKIHWKTISKLKHTIEPFVYYNYVPNTDQSDFPLFDELDRIEGRSLLTYGFTSRLFARGTSRLLTSDETAYEDEQPEGTQFSGVGAREMAEFTLEQAYDTTHAIAKGTSRWSDLQASATIIPTYLASVSSTVGYDPRDNRLTDGAVYLTFQPPWSKAPPNLYMGRALEGSFIQVAYNYIAPGPTALQPGINSSYFEFLSVRLYYDLFNQLGVFFAPSYDIANNQLLSAEYGVRVQSPCHCWAADVGITQSINPNETAVQFMITLGGIGSVGQNPFGRSPFQHNLNIIPGIQ